MKKNKSIWWVVGAAFALGGLFAYPRFFGDRNGGAGGIGSGVPCLVPSIPLVQHIHPVLTITVDGAQEGIPANIGLAGCERAIHTHDDDAPRGVIHVESQDRRRYALGDFFLVWGKPIVREGYVLTTTTGGKPVANPELLEFEDGQDIRLDYKTINN